MDLRRSVLCGELHLSREVVDDGADTSCDVALALLGATPVATGRLIRKEGLWVLEHIAVRAAQRRGGLGRALVDLLLGRCRSLGGGAVHAVAPAAAGAFFRALGFEAIGQADEGAALQAWRRAL